LENAAGGVEQTVSRVITPAYDRPITVAARQSLSNMRKRQDRLEFVSPVAAREFRNVENQVDSRFLG